MLKADHYKPQTIYDFVYCSEHSRELIEEIVEGHIPFPSAGKNGIILWGIWGTGKTELAKKLPHALERRRSNQEPWVEFVSVKANGTGLKIVNHLEEITWTNPSLFSEYHYIILDEVDLLGKEGMESLKSVMRRETAVFIMTTNNLQKIDPAVLNRSVIVEFNKPPAIAWLPTVKRICKDHSIEVTDEAAVLEYIDKCDGSAREILMQTFRYIGKVKRGLPSRMT